MQTKNLRFIAAICLIGTASPALPTLIADDLSASQTVIVISPKTKVFASDKPIGDAPPGSILHYTKTNEKWLMVPRFQGWVNIEDVLPVESAVKHFDKVIAEKPTAEAYHHRGLVQMQFEEYQQALADFDQSIKLGNSTPQIYINRGNALQEMGEVQRAVADFTQAIKLNPTLGRAYDNRSAALAELGFYKESLADSNEAIKLDPSYPEAYNNRGVTYTHQKDYAKAVADFNKAIELFPKYADAYANRGIARKESGDAVAAVADYEAALTFLPDSPSLNNELARIQATTPDTKVRNPKRAVELAEASVVATERKDGKFLDCLAAAYAASERFDQAVKTAIEAVKVLGTTEEGKEASDRLELYRGKKPFVETMN